MTQLPATFLSGATLGRRLIAVGLTIALLAIFVESVAFHHESTLEAQARQLGDKANLASRHVSELLNKSMQEQSARAAQMRAGQIQWTPPDEKLAQDVAAALAAQSIASAEYVASTNVYVSKSRFYMRFLWPLIWLQVIGTILMTIGASINAQHLWDTGFAAPGDVI